MMMTFPVPSYMMSEGLWGFFSGQGIPQSQATCYAAEVLLLRFSFPFTAN